MVDDSRVVLLETIRVLRAQLDDAKIQIEQLSAALTQSADQRRTDLDGLADDYRINRPRNHS